MLKGLNPESFERQKNLILNFYNLDINFCKLVDHALFPFPKNAASKVKSYFDQPNRVNWWCSRSRLSGANLSASLQATVANFDPDFQQLKRSAITRIKSLAKNCD
jgi:hypothetical protein